MKITYSSLIIGLSYQILYKSVFKLPDVEYAVNKMLHECDNDVKYDSWSKDDEITCYSDNKWFVVNSCAIHLTYCVIFNLCYFKGPNLKRKLIPIVHYVYWKTLQSVHFIEFHMTRAYWTNWTTKV